MTNNGRKGFSLAEILLVLAIISLLSYLLFPVFVLARKNSRTAVCASNLKQLGMAVTLYQQDYDDLFPYGGDPTDLNTDAWQTAADGQYKYDIDRMAPLTYVLRPYIKSRETWHCPSDTGFDTGDMSHQPLDARPSSYEKFGMSYYYRTELTLKHKKDLVAYTSQPPYPQHGPDEINVLADGHGGWHGEEYGIWRYNVLFADGHVKNLTNPQLHDAWRLKLDMPSSPNLP